MRFRKSPHRKDTNHDEIAKAFRDHGFTWHDTHMVGSGFPDGVAGKYGINCLIEIKPGEGRKSQQELNENETDFAANWLGWRETVLSIQDVESVNRQFKIKAERLGTLPAGEARRLC